MIFFRKFQIAIVQKLLGIFKIRLQIRISRTRFSLKRKCLIIEMLQFLRKFWFERKKKFVFFNIENPNFFTSRILLKLTLETLALILTNPKLTLTNRKLTLS